MNKERMYSEFIDLATTDSASGKEEAIAQKLMPKLEELGLTNETMTQALAEAYQEAADRYGMKIAHVGRAFSAFRKVFPDVDLYNEDLSHPSVEGSNLAAETILKTVIGLI